MTQAEKTIARVNYTINKSLEKLHTLYREAEGNYRDTGYLRYYNRMDQLEEQIDQLEYFRDGRRIAAVTNTRNECFRDACGKYRNKLNDLKKDYPGEKDVQFAIDRCREIFAITVESEL